MTTANVGACQPLRALHARGMRTFLPFALLAMVAPTVLSVAQPAKTYGLVIHGGAGVIVRKDLSPEKEAEYRAVLAQARDAGYAVLERGGPALDAVVAVITIMEDSPLFNAGKGAVFNADGFCELDASIMDGGKPRAGAVAGVQHIKNPITLARAVMEKSEHVMLMGEGAEKFAKQLGFDLVPNEYFQTDFRRQQLQKAKEKEAATKKSTAALTPANVALESEFRHGTVGCVALDQAGNLAAGTSTGGMTNKKFGRVGDAPIIGAGTYASNATCAVSATGWGEFFIRVAQMEYKDVDLAEAAAASIAKVGKLGGDGGVIALDREGHVAMKFNSPGMYRGYKLSSGAGAIEIFGEKE